MNILKSGIQENIQRIGKAFHEFPKDEGNNSNLYGSLLSASKAAVYDRDIFYKLIGTPEFDNSKEIILAIYIPVVIFNGKLFEVYNDEKGEIILNASQYIPIEMQYSSPKYNEGGFYNSYFPDLITLDYLTEYLKIIDNWIEQMWNGFKKDVEVARITR